MKRLWIFLMALILGAALSGSVLGSGDSGDPVVSLSYLEQVFTPEMEEAYQAAVYGGLGAAYRDALMDFTEEAAARRLADQQAASAIRQRMSGTVVLKKGDMLTAEPGCKVTVLSGSLVADTSYLVDVTRGQVVAKYATLSPGTLYMMGDTTTGELLVSSATCELTVSGVCRLDPSDATDYGSMAQALRTMGLFQGTAGGFSLENTANRAQGLVMFLRLLGLEEEALSYSGSCPFTDVPRSHWAYSYVAYAYSQGLTTGTSATNFSPDRAITCQHYATFLLRALHYSEGTEFSYQTAVSDLASLGLFDSGETAVLSAGAFYRYKMVYLSYYALFGVDQATGNLMMNDLTRSGMVDTADLSAALLQVSGRRIS